MSDEELNEKFRKACSVFTEAQYSLNKLRIEQYKKFDMLDEDGYPTNAALKIIELWTHDDKKGWFDFINSIWWEPKFGWSEGEVPHDYKGDRVYQYELSTGGWSGNESIIEAMEMNKDYLWTLTWVQSRRGGHYIFQRQLDE